MKLQELRLSIRNKLIDAAIIAASIFFIPALLISFKNTFTIGVNLQLLVYLICTLILYLLLWFRKKVKLEIKVHLFLSMFIVVAWGALLNYKLAGAFYFMLIGVVVASLVLGRKTGLFYTLLFMTGYLVLAVLHGKKLIPVDIDFNLFLGNPEIWIHRGLGIIFASAIIIYLSGLYEKLFFDSLSTAEIKSKEYEETLKYLKFSEKRFRLFMDHYPHPIAIKNEKLNYVYRNKASRDGHTAQSPDRMILDEFKTRVDEAYRYVLQHNKYHELDLESIPPDGTRASFRLIQFPLPGPEGEKLIGSITLDTTEQKRMEQMLEQSEIKYRSIIEGSLDGFVLFDSRFFILEVNQSFIAMTGFNMAELKNIEIGKLFKGQSFEMKNLALTISNAEENWNSGVFELELVRKDGVSIPVEINLHKLSRMDQAACWAVVRDITERKQMDLKLFQGIVNSEEKERERYARELHDGLGPLLSTCNIYLHALANDKDQVKHQEYLRRASALLNDAYLSIKEISNNMSPDILKKYGLVQAVRSFIEKLSDLAGIEVKLKTNLETRLPELIEFTIFRTLIELINNSVKHAACSEIDIEVEKGGDELVVHYSDNGKGFDYIGAIASGKGFGLLNLENRVRKIGGDYQYISRLGKGVEVLINFKNQTI